MSLTRQLFVMFFGLIGAVNIISASFLTVRRFLIVPGTHPALEQMQQVASIPTTLPQSLRWEVNNRPIVFSVVPTVLQPQVIPGAINGVSLTLNQWSGRDNGIMVYGHRWSPFFSHLQQSRLGDVVTLSYGQSQRDEYVIRAVLTMSSARIEQLTHAHPDRLVLYTEGEWTNQQRIVVIAERPIASFASQSLSLHDPQTNPVFTVE